MKRFLVISKHKNFYHRQEYIINKIKEYFYVDLIYLDDIFEKYSFFYKYGGKINSYWSDSYQFYYSIFKKIILENINPYNYSGLIVTYDWDMGIQACIKIFKEFNIPTFNILHEGFYININDWYNIKFNLIGNMIKKSKKNFNIPVTDYTFVWWDVHKKEFLKRGYKGIIESVGTFKFEKYNNLKLDKKVIKNKLGIKDNSVIYSYIYQSLDKEKNLKQIEIIKDLYDYIKKEGNIKLLVRNQLGCDYIQNSDLQKLEDIIIDGLDGYKISAEETVFVSDKIFGINSTMLLEGIYMGKDCYAFKYFSFTSPFLNEKMLTYIYNKNEIKEIINNTNKKIDKNELKKLQLYGDINKILKYLNNTKDITKIENNFKKKYYLKYIYVIINPFLIKNILQVLLNLIKERITTLFIKKNNKNDKETSSINNTFNI